MELKFFAATDVGRQRDHNEDNYLVDPKLHLFVVADGMGGHAAGEVASQIAVHEVSRVVRENADVIERYVKEPRRERRARRSWRCWSTRCRRPARRSTTAARPSRRSAAWAPPPRRCSSPATAASSPTSATRASTCCARARCTSSPRTTRSSTSWSGAARSSATRSTARPTPSTRTRSPARSAPTRASRPTRSTSTCCPATTSCSAPTGCTPTSRTRDVPEILTADDIADAPKTLVALANAGGGHDNITAVVVRVEAGGDHGARRRAPAIWPTASTCSRRCRCSSTSPTRRSCGSST